MAHRSASVTVGCLEEMVGPGSMMVASPVYLVCAEINAGKKWMREFAAEKEKSKVVDFQIITDVRADWLDQEQVDLLVRMKTHEVIAALESPNPTVLDFMDRKMDPLKFVKGYKMFFSIIPANGIFSIPS